MLTRSVRPIHRIAPWAASRLARTADAWRGDINGRQPRLTHEKALILQTTIFDERAYDAGLREAMRTVIDQFTLTYPGIKKVEHEFFYAVHGADDDTRRMYLERAYTPGRHLQVKGRYDGPSGIPPWRACRPGLNARVGARTIRDCRTTESQHDDSLQAASSATPMGPDATPALHQGERAMAAVHLIKRDSIAEQVERLHQRIAERAYALFRGRNGVGADPFGDWLSAEQELVWKPATELREQDGTVTVLAALPGVEAKDIEVDVTPLDVVIKAGTTHSHTEDKGTVHRCEFVAGGAFRSIGLPKAIDTAKVKADYQNGMLRITAPVAAEAQTRRVQVSVA